MLRSALCIFLILQGLTSTLSEPETRFILGMKTGVLLRMHVIAQDDSEEMQRIKLCVRDAVRSAYDANCPDPAAPMLQNTLHLIPELTEAAQTAARQEGFEGPVSVVLETCWFDAYDLDPWVLPEGEYPALMIRMGDARGRNWWGVIDPALALDAARFGNDQESGRLRWDWSLRALLRALFQWTEVGHA